MWRRRSWKLGRKKLPKKKKKLRSESRTSNKKFSKQNHLYLSSMALVQDDELKKK